MRKEMECLLVAVFFLYAIAAWPGVSRAAELQSEAEWPLGLRDAVEMALGTVDHTRTEIAHWRVKEEQGRLWPELSVQGYSLLDDSNIVTGRGDTSIINSGDKFQRNATDLVLSYNLLQFLESHPRIRQAQADKRAAVFRLQKEESETILQVCAAYLTFLSSEETLAALESLRREQLNFVRQQEAKFQEELITSIDRVRVENNLISLNREILAVRRDIALAELNVRRLTRLNAEKSIKLVFNPDELDFAFIKSQGLAGLLVLARDANPHLLAAEATVDGARSGAEAARALRYPTLSASAFSGIGYDKVTGQDQGEATGFRYGASLRFTFPLFDAGVRQARITQANLRVESQLSEARRAAQDVKVLIEEEYWSFIQKDQEKALMEQQVRLARDELRQARARFETSLREVLDAVSNAMRFERDFARLKSDVVLKGVQLALIVGRNPFTPSLRSPALRLEVSPPSPLVTASATGPVASEASSHEGVPAFQPAAVPEPAAGVKRADTAPPPSSSVASFKPAQASARNVASAKPSKPARMLRAVEVDRAERSTKIRIMADGAIPHYTSYKLHQPARLVVDLDGLVKVAATVKKAIPVQSFGLNLVRIGLHPDKVRIVLDLAHTDVQEAQLAPIHEGIEIVLSPSR